MSYVTFRPQVMPGAQEYVGFFESPEADGVMTIFFDEEVVIDDIFTFAEATTVKYDIDIAYPTSASSGRSMTIESGITQNSFVLNNTGSNANLWYRLPAGSSVKVTLDNTSSGWTQFEVSIIARAA